MRNASFPLILLSPQVILNCHGGGTCGGISLIRDGWIDTCRQMGRWMDGQMGGWVDIGMDGWMDGQMDGLVGRWMDGWVDKKWIDEWGG